MAQTTKHPVDNEANVEERTSSVNAVSDIENQRQINDLRSEYLDDRAASLNQWLVVIKTFGSKTPSFRTYCYPQI